MKRGHKRGFTVLELLVVIVVVAVLASVIAVMYNSAQAQARDTKLRDAVDKISDAIQLFAAREGHFPVGGYNSTTPIAGTECADGANGWFDVGYQCTISDTLIASGYLPASLETSLPTNLNYAGTPRSSIMVYKYGTNKALVYFSLEVPSAKDTADFNAAMTRCGLNPAGAITQRDSYGMRSGVCIDY